MFLRTGGTYPLCSQACMPGPHCCHRVHGGGRCGALYVPVPRADWGVHGCGLLSSNFVGHFSQRWEVALSMDFRAFRDSRCSGLRAFRVCDGAAAF